MTIVKGCSRSKTFCLNTFLHPPVERSGLPRCHPWSLSAESVQGLEHHEAIVHIQHGRWYFDRDIIFMSWRESKSWWGFSLSMQVSVGNQVYSLLDVTPYPHSPDSHLGLLDSYHDFCSQLVLSYTFCVSNHTPTVGNDCQCDSALYHKSPGHRETADLRWARFVFCFFLLDWDADWTSCGGATVEEYGNSEYPRPTSIGRGGTAAVLRVQKANCWLHLFFFQPLPSNLQRLLTATTGFVFVTMSVKRCFSGFMFLEKHLHLSVQESLYFCSFFFLNQSN